MLRNMPISADDDEQIAMSKKCGYCEFCSVAIPETVEKERKDDGDDMKNIQRLISEIGRHGQ